MVQPLLQNEYYYALQYLGIISQNKTSRIATTTIFNKNSPHSQVNCENAPSSKIFEMMMMAILKNKQQPSTKSC